MVVFHWSFSDSKSLQVSRTLLSILADLINAVVRIVSTFSLISKSSSPYKNHLVTVPRVSTTIGYNHFHVPFIFQLPSKSRYLSFFSHSFNFTLWSTGTRKVHNPACFLLIIIRPGLLARIRWFVWMLKSQKSLCVSFSRIDSGFLIYHLFVWSN